MSRTGMLRYPYVQPRFFGIERRMERRKGKQGGVFLGGLTPGCRTGMESL